MKDEDRKDFAALMLAMGEAFDRDITEVKIDLYFKLLGDIPLEELKKGVLSLLINRVFSTFPSIAEIRNQVILPLDQRAIKAWNELNIKAREFSCSSLIKFDDPLLETVLKKTFGGWDLFLKLSTETEPSDRRQFIESYKVYVGEIELKKLIKSMKEVKLLNE